MITPTELTCEYAPNPINIDTLQPRFGWLLESDRRNQSQSAYQILVASSAENIHAGRGDKWDSGKVNADRSVNVAYAGGSLSSDESCWWQVRVWDQDDRASAYSGPATFTMGLLERKRLDRPLDRRAIPMSRHPSCAMSSTSPSRSAAPASTSPAWAGTSFTSTGSGSAIMYSIAATSDYTQRVLYVTHDVTELLQAGANAVGVMLGNGWYSEPGWEHRYGDSPRLRMQMNLEYADGSTNVVTSGAGWKTVAGPITRNDLYGGETYDARREQPGWASDRL